MFNTVSEIVSQGVVRFRVPAGVGSKSGWAQIFSDVGKGVTGFTVLGSGGTSFGALYDIAYDTGNGEKIILCENILNLTASPNELIEGQIIFADFDVRIPDNAALFIRGQIRTSGRINFILENVLLKYGGLNTPAYSRCYTINANVPATQGLLLTYAGYNYLSFGAWVEASAAGGIPVDLKAIQLAANYSSYTPFNNAVHMYEVAYGDESSKTYILRRRVTKGSAFFSPTSRGATEKIDINLPKGTRIFVRMSSGRQYNATRRPEVQLYGFA